jgi:hypothetical protein
MKVRTANGEQTPRLGSLNEIWLAGCLLRELALEGKA